MQTRTKLDDTLHKQNLAAYPFPGCYVITTHKFYCAAANGPYFSEAFQTLDLLGLCGSLRHTHPCYLQRRYVKNKY